MKAEHRHELKTNDLSKALITTGDYVREYGGRVALALAIVILVVVLINTRVKRSRENDAKVRSNLAFAQSQVDQFETVGLDPTSGMPTFTVPQFDEVRSNLNDILSESSDKQVLAQALVAMGDLNWAMANYPDIAPNSAAATRPSYKLEKKKPDYLKEAAENYQQVLDRYPDQIMPVFNARFGLAAVAEQNRQWDQARRQYEQIAKSADDLKTFKQLAEARLKNLDEISKPMMIGQIPDKPELPEPDTFELDTPSTTRPGVSAPTTAAAAAATTTRPAPTTQRAAGVK
jgi:tetratricopeptide (TPR) repeat protein